MGNANRFFVAEIAARGEGGGETEAPERGEGAGAAQNPSILKISGLRAAALSAPVEVSKVGETEDFWRSCRQRCQDAYASSCLASRSGMGELPTLSLAPEDVARSKNFVESSELFVPFRKSRGSKRSDSTYCSKRAS